MISPNKPVAILDSGRTTTFTNLQKKFSDFSMSFNREPMLVPIGIAVHQR
jgi:hypothetical protein